MHKNYFFKLNKLYAVIVLLSAQNAYAANFTIEPFGTLPTTVIPGQSVSANYTLTNMTNTIRNGYAIQGLPATVTQNTTTPNCGNPINLGPKASCALQFTITGAVSSNIAICKGTSCTTATTPLNVSVNSTPNIPAARYVYITQYDSPNSVMVCPLDVGTGLFTFASCVNADPMGTLNNTFPQGIVINNAGTTAYVANGNELAFAYQCPIDQTTGVFTTGCTSTNITSTPYFPYYGMLALDPNNTNVYLSNYDAASGLNIVKCPITNNQIQNSCTASSLLSGSGASYGAGIVVNKANTNVFASLYSITQVASCSVSAWGSSCNLINGVKINNTNTPFSDQAGLALNPDNSILYIADSGSDSVYGCNPLDISGGYFSSCMVATTLTNGHYPWGITVNAKNTYAYFSDYDQSVYACPIAPDGSFPFNTCTQISGFTDPVSIALLY